MGDAGEGMAADDPSCLCAASGTAPWDRYSTPARGDPWSRHQRLDGVASDEDRRRAKGALCTIWRKGMIGGG